MTNEEILAKTWELWIDGDAERAVGDDGVVCAYYHGGNHRQCAVGILMPVEDAQYLEEQSRESGGMGVYDLYMIADEDERVDEILQRFESQNAETLLGKLQGWHDDEKTDGVRGRASILELLVIIIDELKEYPDWISRDKWGEYIQDA